MERKKDKNREELIALMFELGRLMKSDINRGGCPIPSFLHAETLRFISESGSPTMREIAEYLKVTPPTATALINSFVDDKIIERVTDSDDRRKVRLSLSKKGEKLFDEMRSRRKEAIMRIFSTLSDADSRELARILTIITRPES